MKSLMKKMSYVFFSNITNAISKLLIIVLITKILGEYELGAYTFALAITAPITLLFNMKLRSYIVSHDKIDYKKFTNFRKISNFCSILLIMFVAIMFYSDIAIIILLVAIIKVIDINTEYYQAYPNKEKLFELPSKLMIIKVSISTMLFFVILLLTKSLMYALMTQTLFLLIYLLFERKINLSLVNLKKYVSDVDLKRLFIFLIPLGMVQAMLSFSTNIPKYLLEQLGTLEAVGIFSGVLYIVTIFNLLMTTLNQTLLPYLKDRYMKDIKKYNYILNFHLNVLSCVIGIIFILISYFYGGFILTILYSNEFAQHSYLLIIFGVIIALNMSGWGYDSSLLLAGALKFQPYILGAISVITLIIGVPLITELELLGAGLTLLALNILNTLSKALYYNFYIKRRDFHS